MPTRFLFAGDPGDDLPFKQSVIDTAAGLGCAAACFLGDTAYDESDDTGRRHLDEVSAAATTAGVAVWQLDGNHENHHLLWDTYADAPRSSEGFWQLRSHVYYIPRGHAWTTAGVRFLGLGGAYSVDKARRLELERQTGRPGSLWSPDEELTDDDVVRASAAGPVDIMLTHDKPRGTNPGVDFRSLPDCWANQDRVSQVMNAVTPELLLHGHLHFPYEDHVRVGPSGDWCQVISLESDELGSRNRPCDERNAWLVLELDTGRFELSHLPPALAAA